MNALAVQQDMTLRQNALNNQQRIAQVQSFSDAYGSVHAQPLQRAARDRQHAELRALVRGLRPEEAALVSNADLARRLRGFDVPSYHAGSALNQTPSFRVDPT